MLSLWLSIPLWIKPLHDLLFILLVPAPPASPLFCVHTRPDCASELFAFVHLLETVLVYTLSRPDHPVLVTFYPFSPLLALH